MLRLFVKKIGRKCIYDLFLTDKRMVLIHKKSKLDTNYGTIIGGVFGGTLGAIFGTVIKKRLRFKYKE